MAATVEPNQRARSFMESKKLASSPSFDSSKTQLAGFFLAHGGLFAVQREMSDAIM